MIRLYVMRCVSIQTRELKNSLSSQYIRKTKKGRKVVTGKLTYQNLAARNSLLLQENFIAMAMMRMKNIY